jgi:hypothetical protein
VNTIASLLGTEAASKSVFSVNFECYAFVGVSHSYILIFTHLPCV